MEQENADKKILKKKVIPWVCQEMCVLCMLPKREPMFVPCGHSFCCKCATQMILLNSTESNPHCPLCPLIYPETI